MEYYLKTRSQSEHMLILNIKGKEGQFYPLNEFYTVDFLPKLYNFTATYPLQPVHIFNKQMLNNISIFSPL